jgi:hypothetical protein
MTENYFVIVEQPLNISVGSVIMAKLQDAPPVNSFRWHQNENVNRS